MIEATCNALAKSGNNSLLLLFKSMNPAEWATPISPRQAGPRGTNLRLYPPNPLPDSSIAEQWRTN